MAKGTKTETPEEIGTQEVSTEETSSSPKDEKVTEAVAATEKIVKVRGLVNHECTIGVDKIYIEKNKETKLPVGQAMILQNANVVAILM